MGEHVAHLTQTRSPRIETVVLGVLREIRKEMVRVPVIVPLWWGAWKICDLLRGLT